MHTFDPVTFSATEALRAEVSALRAAVLNETASIRERFRPPSDDPALVNLAHYLALRRHDLRPLQRELMWRGLSSLGRLESRVLPTLDAVLSLLDRMTEQRTSVTAPDEAAFFAGEARLEAATDTLFGPPLAHRRGRIMVTLPSEAADDAALVAGFARSGMDIARINCAHDDSAAWRAMSLHVRAAGELVGRRLSVLMDIAGPKIRTETVLAPDRTARLMPGEALRLVAAGAPRVSADVRFSAAVSLPEMVSRLSRGDRFRYDDGKLEGTIETVSDGEAVVRIGRTRAGGTKLKPQKGINLPDTALGLAPLTAKDEGDLATVVECADMIGYSFVSRPEDIDLLEEALHRTGANDRPLGLVAKIERPEAVSNLDRRSSP